MLYEKETFMDKFGRLITKAGTAIMMNLMFIICCIPVVTAGQAWCGLLTSVRYQIRGDGWWEGFKFGFKTRFLRGTIAWCVLLVVDVYTLYNIMLFTATEQVLIPNLIASCVIFALMAMLTAAVLMLNVYIPTPVGKWLSNAASLVFKVPVQLLAVAAIMWLPILLTVFYFEMMYYTVMIFLVVYFTLAAFGATILLKNALTDLLAEARMEGTLLAEEGKARDTEEETETTEENE